MFLHLSASHSVRGGSAPVHGGIHHHLPGQTLPKQTPTWADIIRADTSTPGQTSPRQTPPRQTPPWIDTPLGRHPSSRRLLLRTVRILLECILVASFFCNTQSWQCSHFLHCLNLNKKLNAVISSIQRSTKMTALPILCITGKLN